MAHRETIELNDPRGDELLDEMQRHGSIYTEGVNIVGVTVEGDDYIVMGFVVNGTFVNMLIPAEAAGALGQSVVDLANDVMQKKMN